MPVGGGQQQYLGDEVRRELERRRRVWFNAAEQIQRQQVAHQVQDFGRAAFWGAQGIANPVGVDAWVGPGVAWPAAPVKERETRKPSPTEEETGVLANKFLIGCDPEWVVVKDGRIVRVTDVIRTAHGGDTGYDHGGYVAELHPEPAHGSYALVKKMRSILRSKELEPLRGMGKWVAGAKVEAADPGLGRDYATLGGHVHVDIDPTKDPDKHTARVAAMDCFTRRLEALDILPQKQCESRRRSNYGRFGDIRYNDDFNVTGKRRFEYRTLPSWLYSPKIAMLCLTGIKLAAVDPDTTVEKLGRFHDYARLKEFFEAFKAKDINARRVEERVLGDKVPVMDPGVDVRDRWEELDV